MNVLQKLPNFEIHFHRSGIKTQNCGMTIICSIILFTTWCFSFLNAICISKVPEHYINRKIRASTARTAVICPSLSRSLLSLPPSLYLSFYLSFSLSPSLSLLSGVSKNSFVKYHPVFPKII